MKFLKAVVSFLFSSFVFYTQLHGVYDNPFDFCYYPDRFWDEAEYLYWKIQDSPKPINLVQSDSHVVLGGKRVDTGWRPGGRFALGGWFDDQHCFGVEANYFFLPHVERSRSVSSDGSIGSALLTIPFFDVTLPGQSFTFLSLPGFVSGTAKLKVKNNMQGAELNGIIPIRSACNYDLSILAGFRYWNFDEDLTFSTSSSTIFVGDVFKTKDKFNAHNHFYAGQIGLRLNCNYNCFFFNFKGKVALGAMHEKAIIKGRLATNDFDGLTTVQNFSGGYFALPTNIGNHKHTLFSVLSEADFRLGYQWDNLINLYVGYTFLYVNKMLWAAKEMDSHINPTQSVALTGNTSAKLVGQARPKARLKSESLWVQGLTVGVGYTF